jgi:hypothetical protein
MVKRNSQVNDEGEGPIEPKFWLVVIGTVAVIFGVLYTVS